MSIALLHFLKQHLSGLLIKFTCVAKTKGLCINRIFSRVGCPLSGAKKWLNKLVTEVSHSCLLIELGPICNSMAASL